MNLWHVAAFPLTYLVMLAMVACTFIVGGVLTYLHDVVCALCRVIQREMQRH